MTPIFEARLLPKDPKASIAWVAVRVDDPVNIDTHDKCMEFLERQFPMYKIHYILRGVKDVDSNPEVQ